MRNKRVLVVGAGTMGSAYARMIASGRVAGAELAGIVDIDGADSEGRSKVSFEEGLEVTRTLVAVYKSLESGEGELV
jgi:predicted dehydrogenase